MKERRVDAGGVRLNVAEEGEGPPVLVLHGFTGDASSMAPVSEGLRNEYRVLRLELVGHGQSEVPEDPAAFTMPACAEQVAAVVSALDLGRPHLVGYSMGGRAALAAAVQAPSCFASLVLIGATAGIEGPALRQARIAADEALALRIEREGLEAFVDRWMALPLFASQQRLGPAALAAARAQRLRNSPRGLAESLRGMGAGAQPPLFAKLGTLNLPTLLVAGSEDEKFRHIAADLAARMPRAQTAILPDAGHAAHLEAPGLFAEAVRTFWRALPAEPKEVTL